MLKVLLFVVLALAPHFFWFVSNTTLKEQIADMEKQESDRLLAIANSVAEQRNKDIRAFKNANKKADELRSAVDDLDGALRLRDEAIDSLSRARAPSPVEAALTTIYRECSDELVKMGTAAQKHLNEVDVITEREP